LATSRARRAAALGAVALSIAAAAIAQERPESLLPPGFGEPAPTPSATVRGPAPLIPAPVASGELPPLPPLPIPTISPSATPTLDASQMYQMPAFARRSLSRVGPAAVAPADAFGRADGRYLETLMRRLAAPLPSRWLSIALRRLLVSGLDTPANVNGADFAAERAWLLLRMGESVSARAVAQGVDTDRVTPKLTQVWMQAALANADPAGLCPLADQAGSNERGWVVARAMCAALGGTTQQTKPMLADIRRRRIASGVDLQLAQKVMGAGLNSRQAITIEWTPVTQLTTWRFGLATATGVAVPDDLYATAGPQVTSWRALSPAIPLAERAAPAEAAAAMGVISNVALVDLYSALADDPDAPAGPAGVANDLRDAYTGNDRAARIAAMKRLWDGASTPSARYARLILTARAAARVPVADDIAEADRLVSSMLSAGLDRTVQRWRGHVPAGGDGWAMLTVADADSFGRASGNPVDEYAPTGAFAQRKRQLFFAGLAGLGRLSPEAVEAGASALDIRIGAENAWTRALERAAGEGQQGTVILLAAIGMQTADWSGVPPAALYRIVTALRLVGLDNEARMIAAEAIARL
jgi:hypothetical protein